MTACLAKSGRSLSLSNALNDLFPISLKLLPILPSLESCIAACFLTPESPPFGLLRRKTKWRGPEVQVGDAQGNLS